MTTPARPFGTVLTAMVTPMFDDGEIDFDAVKRLAAHLVAHGSDGLVLSGTTGEAPTTHAPEKVDLILAVREAVGPGVAIITGAGSNDTAHAVRMAEQGAEAGADGILALVPYYSRPSQPGIVAHLTAIAGASGAPVMVYDIPGRTGVALSDASYDALAEVPTIVAVKDATGDVAAAAERIGRTGLVWYSGDDPLTLDFLRVGAVGVVSVISHVAGERIAAMIAAHDAGDSAAADALNAECAPINAAIMGAGLGAVMAKAAVQALGLIGSRAMRLPHLSATEAEYAALTQALRAAGYDVAA